MEFHDFEGWGVVRFRAGRSEHSDGVVAGKRERENFEEG